MNGKSSLKFLAEIITLAGILSLVSPALAYLIYLINKLVINFGNILIKILSGIPLIGMITIILFIAAGILWVGTLLKNEEDQISYVITTYITWIADGLILAMLAVNFVNSSILIPLIVGIGFTLFIAPPIIYEIGKGLRLLINKSK